MDPNGLEIFFVDILLCTKSFCFYIVKYCCKLQLLLGITTHILENLDKGVSNIAMLDNNSVDE